MSSTIYTQCRHEAARKHGRPDVSIDEMIAELRIIARRIGMRADTTEAMAAQMRADLEREQG